MMRKRLVCFVLCSVMICSLIACGAESKEKEENAVVEDVENVDEDESKINENILAVAELDSQFDSEELAERANNRMKTQPEFFAGSKVPTLESCVTGMVLDEVLTSDGNYVYYFGEGEDAMNQEVYLSGVLAYAAHLHALGLTYELNDDEMCYIYDGSEVVAQFMVFITKEDGYVMIITPN